MNTRIAMITATLLGLLLSGVAFADDDDDDDDRHERRDRHEHHERHHRHERHRHKRHRTHTEVVYAQVIYVEPIYRVVNRVRPRRECWSETYNSGGHDDATGLVLGGILGGVIGQNLSHGHNSNSAVLAGTLLGATIGHNASHSGGRAVTRTHCESRDDFDEVEEIISYRVKYRHTGRIYETRTERHPGPRVRVTVNIDD